VPHGWEYLHPVQDVQAATAAIRAGLKSRSDVIKGLSGDPETVDAEAAADKERADALGLVFDSDPSNDPRVGPPTGEQPRTQVPSDAADVSESATDTTENDEDDE
ncbi:MAG TPA: phage portal protein, partial [Chloroflexota bacterium]|nr:phage portal protein [Chloroflexota bacterium]